MALSSPERVTTSQSESLKPLPDTKPSESTLPPPPRGEGIAPAPPSASDYTNNLQQILQIDNPAQRDLQLAQLLQRWVATDPSGALRDAPGIAPVEMHDQITRQVIAEWVLQDPENAARHALNLSDPPAKSRVTEQVFTKIAETKPDQAVKLLQNHPVQPALIENLIHQWALVDLNSAYQWAEAQSPGQLKDELLQRVAFVWAQRNPPESAQFVVDHISPGPTQTEAAVMVIHQWALKDSAAATTWANQFPQSMLRERVLDEISGVAQSAQAGPANTIPPAASTPWGLLTSDWEHDVFRLAGYSGAVIAVTEAVIAVIEVVPTMPQEV